MVEGLPADLGARLAIQTTDWATAVPLPHCLGGLYLRYQYAFPLLEEAMKLVSTHLTFPYRISWMANTASNQRSDQSKMNQRIH